MRTLLVGVVVGCVSFSCSSMPGMDAGVACDLPTGAGTPHSGTVTANETWTAATSPHVIDFELRANATITIEPCATVQLGEGARLIVGTSTTAGKIVASRASFTAKDVSKPWGVIEVSSKGSLDFTDVLISHGANPASAQNGGGAVVAYGEGSNLATLTRSLRFLNVTITNAKGYGVNLQGMSGFTADSTNLRIADSGEMAAPYPILVEAGAVGTLPSVTFTNTRSTDVLVEPRGSMPSDTFKNLGAGAAYRLNGPLRVHPSADGAASTLTVEAGVTLKFDEVAGSGIIIGTSNMRQGLLVVNGTSASPVTFTSGKAAQAPGDWQNIHFNYTPNTGNKIDFAIVEYAGAPSGLQGYGCGPIENDASIIITNERPTSAFITNTTFRNAGGDTALLLGWVSDDSGPDFTATNTFSSAPSCKISRWRNMTAPACPGTGAPVCVL